MSDIVNEARTWEPTTPTAASWEPPTLPPRELMRRQPPRCIDCQSLLSTKNYPPPERCRSCACRARNLARYAALEPRAGRLCGCGEPLASTSRRTVILCRSCSAKAREVVRPQKVREAPSPIKGTEMPAYTGSQRHSSKRTTGFELIACGLGNSPTLYNVLVGCERVGRVEKVDGLWQVQGFDLGTHDKAITAAKILVEHLT